MRRTPLKFLALLGLTAWLSACGGGGSSSSPASSTTTTDTTTAGTTASTAFALGAVKVAGAGANESYAIRATGVSYQWGDNTWGQLGDGTQNKYGPVLLDTVAAATGSSTSTTTTPPATWKGIAAGGSHTLAIKSDGTLWAWGLNLNGQLGDGNSGAGRYVTSPEQIGSAKDWLAVAAGDAHSVALEGTTTPLIMAWGQNAYGQLGLGTTLTVPNLVDVSVPTKTTKALVLAGAAFTLSAAPFTGLPWKSIAAGGNHNLVMRSDGLVFSWGDNSYGQLGQASVSNPSVPSQVSVLGSSALGALAIATGRKHSLAISTKQALYGWGSNGSGQLGDGTTVDKGTAVQIGSDSDWFTVAAGGAHTLAIKKTDRTLWAWGSNSDGQLGDGSQSDSPVPKQIGTATNWVSVSAGRFHSLAIDSDGKLWAWGRNAEGQLGTGKTGSPVLSPTLLP